MAWKGSTRRDEPPILLDRVGRTSEALEVAAAGWERARAIGVERTYGGLLLAVAAKAAIALGRWDEAESCWPSDWRTTRWAGPGPVALQRGRLDTMRGDLVRAAAFLGAAQRPTRRPAGPTIVRRFSRHAPNWPPSAGRRP